MIDSAANPNTPSTILIARSHERASELIQQLALENLNSTAIAVVEASPIDTSLLSETLIKQRFDKVISVSQYASKFAIADSRLLGIIQAANQVFAVGSASAKPLQDLEIEVQLPGQMETLRESSEGLLDLSELQSVANEKILILCGEEGRQKLEQVLADRGASVTRCELYRREFRSESVQELNQLDIAPSVIVALSGFVCECLAKAFTAGAKNSWLETALVVPSQRVGEIAKSQGFTRVFVAEGAHSDALRTEIKKVVQSAV